MINQGKGGVLKSQVFSASESEVADGKYHYHKYSKSQSQSQLAELLVSSSTASTASY